jgi:hypothetical protein
VWLGWFLHRLGKPWWLAPVIIAILVMADELAQLGGMNGRSFEWPDRSGMAWASS